MKNDKWKIVGISGGVSINISSHWDSFAMMQIRLQTDQGDSISGEW
jgi:hypothetical protein